MTVQSTLARKAYTISGAGPYTIPFYFLDDADIIAIRTPADGSDPVTLTITTEYSLTGAGNENGGALTLIGAGIVNDDTIIIINEPAILQLTQYPETGKFPAASHETALDRLTMIAKRIYDLAFRSLRLNDGDTASSLQLPVSSPGKLIGWAGDGTLMNTSPAGVGPGSITTTELSTGVNAVLNVVAGKADSADLGTAAAKNTGTASGTVPLWESLLLNGTAEKTADYEVLTTDRGKLIDFTGVDSWTLSTASGLLAAGVVFAVRNSGTGVITINPYLGEQIDGASTITLAAGESCIVAPNDGATGWVTVGRSTSSGNPIATTVLTSGTSHTLNANTTHVVVEAVGGGGGAAGGDTQTFGGAGAAGAYFRTNLLTTGGAGSLTCSIGSAGTAAAPQASGGSGGNTEITINGTLFIAYGGSGGTWTATATSSPDATGGVPDSNTGLRVAIAGEDGEGSSPSGTVKIGGASSFSNRQTASGNGVSGGGGGGGDKSTFTGGAGGAGMLIITEYKL